ncbi:uncharacterized protein LOC120291801 [Eucalyptus grandis]|uniref:uncharacterized protein LOC120291801 n=1 Tax=Eucalyptus grandis TaxID=71139 RepID=UPI00192EBC4B|nr:uncharacterized protein LOC120291801 [Eucalyptus grandis]
METEDQRKQQPSLLGPRLPPLSHRSRRRCSTTARTPSASSLFLWFEQVQIIEAEAATNVALEHCCRLTLHVTLTLRRLVTVLPSSRALAIFSPTHRPKLLSSSCKSHRSSLRPPPTTVKPHLGPIQPLHPFPTQAGSGSTSLRPQPATYRECRNGYCRKRLAHFGCLPESGCSACFEESQSSCRSRLFGTRMRSLRRRNPMRRSLLRNPKRSTWRRTLRMIPSTTRMRTEILSCLVRLCLHVNRY